MQSSESTSGSSNNSTIYVRKVIDLTNKFPIYPKKKDNNRNFNTIGDDIEECLLSFSQNQQNEENTPLYTQKCEKLKTNRRTKRKSTPFYPKKSKKA